MGTSAVGGDGIVSLRDYRLRSGAIASWWHYEHGGSARIPAEPVDTRSMPCRCAVLNHASHGYQSPVSPSSTCEDIGRCSEVR